jgi:hypothetical protein
MGTTEYLMNFIMKVFPPEATPPSNWARSKKEPLPRILQWLLLGSIWLVLSMGLIIILTITSIALFEWSVPILYDWAH